VADLVDFGFFEDLDGVDMAGSLVIIPSPLHYFTSEAVLMFGIAHEREAALVLLGSLDGRATGSLVRPISPEAARSTGGGDSRLDYAGTMTGMTTV
jgi:hypothetical protein